MASVPETIKKNMDAYKIPPPRTLGDFLLNMSRYSMPTFTDLKRLNNRMVCNLMYYQTNYFLISLIISVIFLFCGMRTIIVGAISAVFIAASTLFLLGKLPNSQHYKSDHPAIVVAIGVALFLTVFFALRSILYLLLTLLTPLPIWFVHSATRKRNWKNKITNKIEQVGCTGLSLSPMGLLLQKVLGFNVKDISENHSED